MDFFYKRNYRKNTFYSIYLSFVYFYENFDIVKFLVKRELSLIISCFELKTIQLHFLVSFYNIMIMNIMIISIVMIMLFE